MPARRRTAAPSRPTPRGATRRTKTTTPAASPGVIDRYLAGVPADQRRALEDLRRAVRAAAPRAEECISYGMPAFRLDGKALVYFSAWKSHCSFFPGSSTVVAAHERELAGRSTSKGTIHFSPEDPLPAALVRKIVRFRIAEHAAARKAKASRSGGACRR
jgi:uncharacterized protein YdhG (YjbR/CyaY superfamily)